MKAKIISAVILVFMVMSLGGCSSSGESVCTVVPIDMSEAHALQQEADQGYNTSCLNPLQVIQEFLTNELGIGSATIRREDPPSNDAQGKAEYLVEANNGKIYRFHLTKPTRIHPTGIWAVEKYCKEK
ncbi:MAG: hypothetical protein WBI80_00640 [Coprothermobacter proteolyticus]|uniref:hypothetical protein n=1 Tax=Coprothermobacter proteolyticus TaxID=35786 RepID=UPI0002E2B633|nr:hypothetical protein [Coprothermobacter proteolyticus]AIA24706.1 hypothetical protein COPRO5265_01910 [Coprothermobacter proteolyticus DSM 5265]